MNKIYSKINEIAIEIRIAYELDPGRFAVLAASAGVLLLIGLVAFVGVTR